MVDDREDAAGLQHAPSLDQGRLGEERLRFTAFARVGDVVIRVDKEGDVDAVRRQSKNVGAAEDGRRIRQMTICIALREGLAAEFEEDHGVLRDHPALRYDGVGKQFREVAATGTVLDRRHSASQAEEAQQIGRFAAGIAGAIGAGTRPRSDRGRAGASIALVRLRPGMTNR